MILGLKGFRAEFIKEAKEKLRRRVEVFITDDKKRILAGQHPEGGVVFPGGGIEKGETINQAATRETLEEVGLKIKQIKGMKVKPQKVKWTDELAKWMAEKGRTHSGSVTYYRTAKIDKPDKSLHGKDGDALVKPRFFTKDELIKKFKAAEGKKDKFKPFRDTDHMVIKNVL